MKKIGWPMLYVFLSKPFNEWSFENFQVTYLANFFSQKSIVFKLKQIKFKIYLNFFFASTASLKAVTGCIDKLENSVKRFGLKKDLN